MKHGDLHMTHECFKQSIDPFYVAACIGQTNIAEQMSPAEAVPHPFKKVVDLHL